jgi:hypothetical protein
LTRRLLTARGPRRPTPVRGALRRRMGIHRRIVRNAAALFVAPGPVRRRALFFGRRRWGRRRTSNGETTLLLVVPVSTCDVQQHVVNIERENSHQNSFFLQPDGVGLDGEGDGCPEDFSQHRLPADQAQSLSH